MLLHRWQWMTAMVGYLLKKILPLLEMHVIHALVGLNETTSSVLPSVGHLPLKGKATDAQRLPLEGKLSAPALTDEVYLS